MTDLGSLLLQPIKVARATENAARAVLENHACAMVLGLNPSEASYDVCIRSLDNTLSRADNTQAVVNIHDARAKQASTLAYRLSRLASMKQGNHRRRPVVTRSMRNDPPINRV
jgi:hypothetical protein